MKKIKLSQNKFTIVDDKDFNYLNQWKWSAHWNGFKWYASKNKPYAYIHRIILNPAKGYLVDHINGDTLDNRRKNLRICNAQQNVRNKIKQQTKTSSIYKGVSWHKIKQSWHSSLILNRKNIHLGNFKSEHHAALMYDFWATFFFGEYAKTNFMKAG